MFGDDLAIEGDGAAFWCRDALLLISNNHINANWSTHECFLFLYKGFIVYYLLRNPINLSLQAIIAIKHDNISPIAAASSL